MKEKGNTIILKKKFIQIQLIICLILIFAFNPITVKLLFSDDHVISSDSNYFSLFLTSFLFALLIIYSLSLLLINNRKTAFPNLVVNLSISALIIILFLVFSEILFRAFFAGHARIQLYGNNKFFGMTWHKPNLNVRLKSKEYDIRFQTNNIGLRDTQDFKGVNENEIRIINIGDSFIQAAQVSIENSMTYILEKRLNSLNPEKKFIVFNLATSGCDPKYERTFMAKNCHVLLPHFLFWYIYIGNDIITRGDFYGPPTRLRRIFNVAYARAQEASSLLRFVEERAKYKREFPMGRPCQPFDGKPKQESTNIFLKEYSAIIDQAYQKLKDEILQMDGVCKREKIILRVVLIPTKEQIDRDKLSEVINYFNYDENDLDLIKPQRLIGKILLENKIEYIDLLETIASASKARKLYFDIDSHWNELGNKVVADKIFGYFCSEFLGVETK